MLLRGQNSADGNKMAVDYAREGNYRALVQWFERGCKDEEVAQKASKVDMIAEENAVAGESASARSRRVRKELEAKESGTKVGDKKSRDKNLEEVSTVEEHVERGMMELKAEHGEFYEITAQDVRKLKNEFEALLLEKGVVGDLDEDDKKEAVWAEVKKVLASADSAQQSQRELNCIKLDAADTTVDPAVWRCRKINRLQLQMPPGVLQVLPIKVQRFRQLDTLILSFNALATLPDSIGTLHKLRILEVNPTPLVFPPYVS